MRVSLKVAHTSIDDLKLSSRAYNCLARNGIETLEDLFETYNSLDELMTIRNMGITTAKEIVTEVQTICPEYTKEEITIENEPEEELFINKIRSIIISLKMICGENPESYESVFADLKDLIEEASTLRETKKQLLLAQKRIDDLDYQMRNLRRYTQVCEERIDEQHVLIEKLTAEKNSFAGRLRQEADFKKKTAEKTNQDITQDGEKSALEGSSFLWLIPVILILIMAGIALFQHLS